MRPFHALPALIVLTVCGASCASAAQTLKVDYGISLAGLPLGSADLATTFEGAKYNMQMGAKLTGLAGLLTGGKGAATASGALGGPRPVPSAFAVTSRSSNDRRVVRMGLNSGNVAALEVVPPVDAKPDRVPLEETHKRGVVDPVSALIMPAAGRDPLDRANCERTIPVFDGAARFDVVLSYSETRTVDKPGYRGQVLVCDARYVPIAGHRSLRPSTKFMQDNKDMQVWLAPVEGTRFLIPLRISVRTMVGVSVIEASNWALQKDGGGLPNAGQVIRAGAAR